MKLLVADLRALANLPATAAGRRLTFATLTGLGLLALMSWWLAEAIATRPRLLQVLDVGAGDDPLRRVLGYGLLACPMVATWLGLSIAQRQLFETPELSLWRLSPLPRLAGPVQILLRAVFLSTLWALALAGPFVTALLLQSPAPAWVFALVPVAIVGCTAPLLAALLAVQILLVRWLFGRWLRLLLAALAALASVAFSTWLLLNLFTTGPSRLREVALAARGTGRLPWTVDAAATLLANAAEGRLAAADVWPLAGWLALTALLFGVAARAHPRAHERYLEAASPLWRRRRRAWPESLAGAMRRKELAQVLQQPGALIGFLVFAVLVFGLARERVLVDDILRNRHLPQPVAHTAAMLAQWFLAVLLVLYTHMGRLALWDGPQWSLYMAAPASPRAILRGKLGAVAVFLLWPLLLVAAAGTRLFAADLSTVACFAGTALGGTAAALGVLAVVGTWPRLMRPDAEGQILQGGRSFLAAMVLVTLFELAVSPAVFGFLWLRDHAQREGLATDDALAAAPWVVGAALAYGALLAAAGVWLGGRNYRRLLAPR